MWGYLLAFGLGILSVHFWQAAKWLSARGIGPDGPDAGRRIALRNGYNGIGPIEDWRERQAARECITATYAQLHPTPPPTPPKC